MYDKSQKKERVVLKNQHKKQESNTQMRKIDQSITSVDMFHERLNDIGNDVGGLIVAALGHLSKPFKEHSKMPFPLRNVQNGEFVGFLTGSIIFDL